MRSRKIADLAAGPEASSIAATAAATSGSVGLASGGGAWPAPDEDVLDGQAEVGMAVVGGAQVVAGHAGDLGDGRGHRRPAEARGALVCLRERSPRQEDRRDGQLVRGQAAEVVSQEGRLLGGARRSADTLGQLAPAAHSRDGIRFLRWHLARGFRRS